MSSVTSVEANTINQKLIVDETYENAVKALNTLQSNAQMLARARESRDTKIQAHAGMANTVGALQTLGLSADIIDTMNVIHVAGTKGKGTTCAFTESILRHAGLKTGFYSSPHLIAVRERIRINGKPLSPDAFAKYFFSVYNKLKPLKEPGAPFEMPFYFRFLTCMAFHVFFHEKVDVIVLEVGVGGMHDSTNVIRKPVAVGITALGLDHQGILGNTLEEIAIQKAGIMKEGCTAYTIDSHPPHILQLLQSYAASVKCSLHTVSSLNPNGISVDLGVDDGFVSRTNAALAVHLANDYLLKKHPEVFPYLPAIVSSAVELKYSAPVHFLPFQMEGLKSTRWDGRFQVFTASTELKYFLDGAHTIESLTTTIKWFQRATPGTLRILIFNCTAGRAAKDFLELFASSGCIDIAIFCPIVATMSKPTPDNWSAKECSKNMMEDCENYAEIWNSLGVASESVVCDCIESALTHITELVKGSPTDGIDQNQNVCTSVLVTGSLHLVGSVLSILNPTLLDD